MTREILKTNTDTRARLEVGSEVSILIDGVISGGWKISKIYDEGPLAGKVVLEKEEQDIWSGEDRGMKKRRRLVAKESLEKGQDSDR